MSLRVWLADRKEGVGWGGTESDSADARLWRVKGPVCQMTVPPIIQYSPVANAMTILKRLMRAFEVLCECHIKTPISDNEGWAFGSTCICSVAARPTLGSHASLLQASWLCALPSQVVCLFHAP